MNNILIQMYRFISECSKKSGETSLNRAFNTFSKIQFMELMETRWSILECQSSVWIDEKSDFPAAAWTTSQFSCQDDQWS